MNLKESFRYQNYLETLVRQANESITNNSNLFEITKLHLKNKTNPEADDVEEIIKSEKDYKNDDVIEFLMLLLSEKDKVCKAIARAKNSMGFNIDAELETNRFRQSIADSIRIMLNHRGVKTTQPGKDYKFNNEGNQAPYYYDIEITYKEAYDREKSKGLMKTVKTEADNTSSKIDEAMVTTEVEFTPIFDVNDTFDEVMEAFMKNHDRKG